MKLQNKLTIFALLCSLVPLIGVATLAYDAARSSLRETVEDDLLLSVGSELQSAQRLIDENVQNVATWAHLGVMQDVMSDDESGDLQFGLMRISQHYPAFADMLVFNDLAEVVAATDFRAFNDDWSNTAVQEAMQRGEHVELPVRLNERLRQQVLTIAYPITADYDQSQVVGMFVASIDWERYQQSLSVRSVFGGAQSHQRQLIMRSTNDNSLLYRTGNTEVSDEFIGCWSKRCRIGGQDHQPFTVDESCWRDRRRSNGSESHESL